jgi:TatD DNase family protein
MIDSHAHLYFDRFDEDRDEVFARARDAGVEAFVVIGCNIDSSRQAFALAAERKEVRATAGIHPCDVKDAKPGDREAVEALVRSEACVGVGETGLDYYWDASNAEDQKASLHWHLDLALDVDLPVVLHCRDAWPDLLAALESRPANPRGIMHCFSGGVTEMERSVALGLEIGIGGPLTYPKSKELREALAAAPLEAIHLETDCPFLPPQPWRGKRNEPSYLTVVRDKLAELKGLDAEEIASATTANSRRLFGL